jgi:hypothetical protein
MFPRTLSHVPDGGWSVIALHLEAADPSRGGFQLTLYPDGRSAQVVFLRADQVGDLLDMAASSSVSDQQLWEKVASVPLEPMPPSRTLSMRLRWLLIDQAAAIRDEVRRQHERRPPPPPAEPIEVESGDAPPPPPKEL